MRNLFLGLYSFIFLFCNSAAPTPFDLYLQKNGSKVDILIKNGQVVDGSGASAYEAAILINADTIAFIGAIDTARIIAKKRLMPQEK